MNARLTYVMEAARARVEHADGFLGVPSHEFNPQTMDRARRPAHSLVLGPALGRQRDLSPGPAHARTGGFHRRVRDLYLSLIHIWMCIRASPLLPHFGMVDKNRDGKLDRKEFEVASKMMSSMSH